jgi:hypothetical protein
VAGHPAAVDLTQPPPLTVPVPRAVPLSPPVLVPVPFEVEPEPPAGLVEPPPELVPPPVGTDGGAGVAGTLGTVVGGTLIGLTAVVAGAVLATETAAGGVR